MRKYLHLLGLFWSTSLSAEMEYRANFALACINATGNMIGSVFIVWLLTVQKFQTIGGYDFYQALIVVGFFFLLDGLANTIMRQNLSRIVRHVRYGTLDFILLKPIDTQFWLSTRNCSPWGLPNAALGLGLVIFGGVQSGLTPLSYALGLLPLSVGMVILYSLWFILGSTTIWFVKVSNITHVLYQLLEAGRFPITAYPAIFQVFFTFVVPVSFMTTFPAEMMIGGGTFDLLGGVGHLPLLAIAIVLALGLFTFSRLFWRFALRYYTSASS